MMKERATRGHLKTKSHSSPLIPTIIHYAEIHRESIPIFKMSILDFSNSHKI